MKKRHRSTWLFYVVGVLANGFVGATIESGEALDPDLARFTGEKRALTTALAKKHEVSVPPAVWSFFDAAQKGDWETTTNIFAKISAPKGSYGGDPSIPREIWGPVHETLGAYEQFHGWNPELLRTFGKGIVNSIPPGSLFIGGTDAGRFVVSALSQSHSEGRPFFTVTQNALADGSYLDYLRDIYATNIYVPKTNELYDAFNEYFKDAKVRMEKNQLMEDEDVKVVDGRIQVSGVGAVMRINEILCKVLIEKNSGREIYLEESYPLKTLYPQSVPHGFVLKINHQPVDHLARVVIDADRKFWASQTRVLLGRVITDSSTVNELCSWSERILVRSNFAGFNGNRAYLTDRQAPQYFSKCRSAIASLYEWRSKEAVDKAESSMLSKEAEHAHREAVTLSPFNPEATWRYTEYLINQGRNSEAKMLIQTILRIIPAKWMEMDSPYLKSSLAKLRRKAKELGIPP
jgi:hypothetical protein